MNNGITKENLLFVLPIALREDESTAALAETTVEVLADRLAEIDRLRIISNIDSLEEPLLDILAKDFKVDWWDPEHSVEEKRRVLKSSWMVHKRLGTKAAVETAISAIYPDTKVEEWFEYDGEPYHFRLNINITNDSINSEKQRRVLERLNYYKSLRSHNDGVTYFMVAEEAEIDAGAAYVGRRMCVNMEIPILGVTIPCADLIVHAGAATTGTYQVYASEIPIHEIATPLCSGLTVQAGIGVLNIYQQMTKEVPLDGTLE